MTKQEMQVWDKMLIVCRAVADDPCSCDDRCNFKCVVCRAKEAAAMAEEIECLLTLDKDGGPCQAAR